MIDFGYNNKKTNIKVNILLAAFLEIELYDNIGVWSYIHKTDDGSYCLRIDTCEDFGINLKDKYNKYHDTIDCYFPDLIESILI